MNTNTMNSHSKLYYRTGDEILTGDSIKFGDSDGEIVFVIDSTQFTEQYPQNVWEYLKNGIGVQTEKYGLIHQAVPDEDLILIKRKITT